MREALVAYVGVQVAAVAVALVAAHGFALFIPEDVGPLVVEASMLAALYAIHRRERLCPGDLGVRRTAPGRATGLVLLAPLCLGFCEVLWARLVHESLGHSLFGGLSGQPAAAVALAGIAACAGAPIDRWLAAELAKGVRAG